MNWKRHAISAVLIVTIVAFFAKKWKDTEEAQDISEDAHVGILDRWPWLPLLPFAITVIATVGLLIVGAFLRPIDAEYTLVIRWSYVGHGTAGAIALLAAFFSTNRMTLRGILIIAIEFYLFGMFMQFLSII